MLIPLGTDAPIYHRPITTVGLIVANVATFADCVINHNSQWDHWVLTYGSVQPTQWLTHNFVHFDIAHLVGNMVFLWAFGLVVEGKIGWWRMLGLYLAIGVTNGAVIQVLSCCFDQQAIGAGGASATIFGLMAICMIWAPMNDARMVFVFQYHYARFFEMPYWGLAMLYIGIDFLLATVGRFELGSSMAHFLGAVNGVAFGTLFVTFKLVDCEHWDLYTLISGKDHDTIAREELRQRDEKHRMAVNDRCEHAIREIDIHLDAGNPELAEVGRRFLRKLDPSRPLPEHSLLRLIALQQQQGFWLESEHAMLSYLDHYETKADAIRIRLADVYLRYAYGQRKALQQLRKVDPHKLDRNELAAWHRMRIVLLSSEPTTEYEMLQD